MKKNKKKNEFLDKSVEIHFASLLAKMKITPSPSKYQQKYTKSNQQIQGSKQPMIKSSGTPSQRA